MRITSLALAALLAAATPALAVDTPAVSQWLVTSGKATGANGENFVTSLRIVNPGSVAANVSLYYYPRVNFDAGSNSASGDNTSAPMQTVVVPPGQTLAIEDVLGTLFGRPGPSDSGGLQVVSDIPVSVLSQTLVTNAKSATGVPGTNGFAIPAQTFDNAVDVGDTGFVPYLSSAPDRTAGYRSDLFLFSLNPSTDTVVNVKLVNGADGSTVGTPRNVSIGKMVQTQINDVGNVFGFSGNTTNLTAVLTIVSGGPVLAGASIIDNAIASQIYSPPTKVWLPSNGTFGIILDDGGYGFAGRLDIVNGLPDFMTLPLVVDNCPASPGPEVQIFFIQAFGSGAYQNTTFSRNADGSFNISGTMPNGTGGTDSTFTGTITPKMDGTVQGSVTYTRSSGGACSGASKVFPFLSAIRPPTDILP